MRNLVLGLLGVCIPLLVSGLSFSNNYGSLTESITGLNEKISFVHDNQDAIIDKLDDLQFEINSVDKKLYCISAIDANDKNATGLRHDCIRGE